MKILSLDQAKTTGFVIFEDSNYKIHGLIKSKKKDYNEVMFDIANQIKRLIIEHQIEVVIIEDIQQMRNVQSFKKLAQLQGILYLICHELDIKYHTIASPTWRKILNSKARKRDELKLEAMKYVKERFKFDVTNDEADAFCMMCYAIESNLI